MSDTMIPQKTRHLALTSRQFLTSIIMGVILWFVAAVLIRILGPMGVFEGSARVLTYALIIPGTAPFIVLIQKVAGLGREKIFVGTSLATMAAMLCDGVALSWFPALYGGGANAGGAVQVAHAGAVILWGAAVGMLIAYFLNRED